MNVDEDMRNDKVRYCMEHILTGWPNETPTYPSRRDVADGR